MATGHFHQISDFPIELGEEASQLFDRAFDKLFCLMGDKNEEHGWMHKKSILWKKQPKYWS